MPNPGYIQSALLDPEIKKVLGLMRDEMGAGGAGVIPAALSASVTAAESGAANLRTTILTLKNMPLLCRDTQLGNGVKIYTFPLGKWYNHGCSAVVTVTNTSVIASTLKSGVSCRAGVGTVTQANATLATTEQNIVQVTTFTAPTTINTPIAAFRCEGIMSVTALDMTTTADAYFNISVPTLTDIDADANLLINGTVTFNWSRA
jgi:hypothetical protein